MYEEHFGLKSNPFRSNAEGKEVYVGPTQEKVMSRIHKGLSAADNIVAISGAVGVGKTTIAARALETNKQNQLVAWIGRMRLAPDEVMQLLLAGFGVTQQVPGTVRQFAVFQRLLSDKAAADTRVVIVIEDALRIGDETLLELEAITATDTGNVGGANLVLMGPPELDQRLGLPALARIRQRSRLAQKIVALNADEVSMYLEHIVRIAGIEANALFDGDVSSLLFELSGGIPRVINNICDAALAEAEEQGQNRITRQLLLAVAADVYGLVPVFDEAASIADPATRIATDEDTDDVEPNDVQAEAEPEPEPEPVPLPDPVAQNDVAPEPPAPTSTLPPVVAASLAQEQEENLAQAKLIEVTGIQAALNNESLPQVPPLVEEMDLPAELTKPKSFNDTADDLPMLSNSMRIDGPITPAPISGDKESTANGANLAISTKPPVPDLDALEAAISAARGGEEQIDRTDTFLPNLNFEPSVPPAEADAPVELESDTETDEELEQNPWPAPEIEMTGPTATNTVPDPDPVLQAEDEPQLEIESEVEFNADPEPELDSEPEPEAVFEEPEAVFEDVPAAAAEEISEITLDNSIDKSLEDQRLEGNKLDEIAAELADADSLEDMSDMMAETLFGVEFEQIAQEALKNPPSAGTLPGDTDVLATDAYASTGNSTSANDPGEEPSPVMLEPEEPVKTPTVSAPVIKTLPKTAKPKPQVSVPVVKPESIEDQIQTEITQTMKTIDPANLPNAELGDDDDKPSGLLGRLKKTFRG
jgi:general secretion pathway protein A